MTGPVNATGMPAGPENENSENFVLDVRLVEVINSRAFRAVLKNGHTLVAYVPRHGAIPGTVSLAPGADARVRMSPFDMSRGELVFPQDVRS
ncbi:MAG TPA: hypothetical protein PKE26_07025 [Kiritimatiellia bacterium]|nr:hypothetical protein [Kiritimatiellia bacterium]HMO98843.1 hypothetical protein [Kiritimatiellia bacterium]